MTHQIDIPTLDVPGCERLAYLDGFAVGQTRTKGALHVGAPYFARILGRPVAAEELPKLARQFTHGRAEGARVRELLEATRPDPSGVGE